MNWKNIDKGPATWKYIFIGLLILTLLDLFSRVGTQDVGLGFIVGLFNLLAIYGLAYLKTILARGFWRVYFWIYSIPAALIISYSFLNIGNFEGVGAAAGFIVACAAVGIQVRGLYLYAYGWQSLWQQPEE